MQQHFLNTHIFHRGSTLFLATVLTTVFYRGNAVLTQTNFIPKMLGNEENADNC